MITYDDVYIRPRHSSVETRDNVNLTTQFTRNYQIGCPIVASPMDTVMGKHMGEALAEEGCTGIMHRFDGFSLQREYIRYMDAKTSLADPICVSVGVHDVLEAKNLIDLGGSVGSLGADVILIDVANGDHALVEEAIKTLHEDVYVYGEREFDIIAGNVATYEGAQNLIDWGVDAIRVGIGNGCFTPNMEVRTKDGVKKIVDVEPGDQVRTHRDRWKEVLQTRKRDHENRMVVVDGIECTPDHEFYVVHESVVKVNEVNEENVHEYAEWVEAQNLSEEYWRVRYDGSVSVLDQTNTIKEKDYNGKVFDLEVEDDHSYNIDGTVVHNSVCSTRIKTGVGVGQITAIREAVRACEDFGGDVPVIADGGIRQPGDAAKALAAGADTVMVGSILAGTDETPGEVKARENGWPDRELYKEYRGSASQGVKDSNDYVEGVTRTVPYRGPVSRIIHDVKDGLRSSYSYVGARNTSEFQAKAKLQQVSGSSNEMGKPHHNK